MKKKNFSLAVLSLSAILGFGQNLKENPLVHTYSIVAYDSLTGEMGVAVQSHWFSVGSVVMWGEGGVGVVATQSFANADFGPDGLTLMKMGLSAKQAVEVLIKGDEGRDFRQLGIVDAKGNAAAYTGEKCIVHAGHHVGVGYSVQANLMLNDKVVTAMAKAFEGSKGALSDRLMVALEAAQSVGGDIRGKQSAALLVVSGKRSNKPWKERLIDLRVEDHKTPLVELKRLLSVHKAYQLMSAGDVAMEKEDVEKAIELYSAAEKLYPDNEEVVYWNAVNLANAGRMKEALPLFKKVFKKNADWQVLTPRLIEPKLLKVDEKGLKEIMGQ